MDVVDTISAIRQIRSTSDAQSLVICAPRPMIADESPTVQIGGSAGARKQRSWDAGQRLPDHVDPSSGRAPQEAVHHLSRRQSARSYAGWMKHVWPVTQAVISLAVWPLTITLSPVILVAGEPVNRYVMRRVRRSAAAGSAAEIGHGDRPVRAVAVRLPAPASLLLVVISNPLWIALTAPGRWVSDRFRRPPSMRAGTAAR